MDRRSEFSAALAALAAASGAGFASGRELAFFFAQLGRASWLGIAATSILYALLMAGVCDWARGVGAGSTRELLQRVTGRRSARAANCLRGVLLAGVAGVMLLRAYRIGALTLPLRHAGLWGAALAAALAIGVAALDGLPWAGGATVLAGVAFYVALALDPRPVRIYARAEVRLALADSRAAALLLAAPYAALCAAVSGGTVLRRARRVERTPRLGLYCGGMLAAVLCAANAALLGGGPQLLGQEAPVALLAGRLGLAGFWLSTGFAFLCAVDTLAAILPAALGRG